MKKFEYNIYILKNRDKAVLELNKLGQEGWEVYQILNHDMVHVLLKRELKE